MSFVYSRSSWKFLSWLTKGSITGTKQGEEWRRQDGDRRPELCSAQALRSGMFHLRQVVSCAGLMGFRLMSGCLCSGFGQGSLIWVWSCKVSV